MKDYYHSINSKRKAYLLQRDSIIWLLRIQIYYNIWGFGFAFWQSLLQSTDWSILNKCSKLLMLFVSMALHLHFMLPMETHLAFFYISKVEVGVEVLQPYKHSRIAFSSHSVISPHIFLVLRCYQRSLTDLGSSKKLP